MVCSVLKGLYLSNTDKMVPETWHCIKEGKHKRQIQKLEQDGQTIADPEEIVKTMQRWYEQTAERVVPQLESLPDFLNRQGLELPQLDDRKSVLEEELTIHEVKQAIQEANKVSAPGPSGQTVTFFTNLSSWPSLTL